LLQIISLVFVLNEYHFLSSHDVGAGDGAGVMIVIVGSGLGFRVGAGLCGALDGSGEEQIST
jgi:hypothetical protein